MRRFIPLAVLIVIIIIIWFALAPPRFWLNMTKGVEPTAQVGEQLVARYGCRGCHRIGGEGAIKAPDLTGITQRVTDPTLVPLRLWLQNPKGVKPNTAMPNFRLSDSQIEAILLYLTELDQQT